MPIAELIVAATIITEPELVTRSELNRICTTLYETAQITRRQLPGCNTANPVSIFIDPKPAKECRNPAAHLEVDEQQRCINGFERTWKVE